MRFANSTVLITGAASGIGRETSRQFIAKGATVIGADINQEGLASATSELGDRFVPRTCNISNGGQVKELYEYVASNFDKLDVLINNAGSASASGPDRPMDVEEIEEENIDFSFGLFLKGPILLVKYFTPLLKKAPNPSIINISSIAAIVEGPKNTLYGLSKAGIDKFTRILTCNLPGIRTNSIMPGLIRTPIIAKTHDNETATAIFEHTAKIVPCGRVGEPQDIAKCILFLSSDDASYINGASIVIDGGLSRLGTQI